jgi:hypothetical protein
MFSSITTYVTHHPWRVILAWILAASALAWWPRQRAPTSPPATRRASCRRGTSPPRAARFGREAFGQVYAATGVVVALASLLGFTLD